VLAGVPQDSPWYVTSEIRRANMQRAAGDAEAGIVTLTALADSSADGIEVDSALGDALRMAERFPEAVAAYTSAIDRIDTPRPAHWVLYYTRGISNERAGDWPAAERDFREALVLQPDQPLVLNYLGYSMVEKQENLDEALGMIEKAVRSQPDDGYITDSHGWVLYRLGRYDEAVAPMLRAVELTPDDPVINDHLGDVLWMVGRKREAEFQWRRALSFGPADEPDFEQRRARQGVLVLLDALEQELLVLLPQGRGRPEGRGDAVGRALAQHGSMCTVTSCSRSSDLSRSSTASAIACAASTVAKRSTAMVTSAYRACAASPPRERMS
jgi:Flp pilus assembly protein TadD